MVSVLDSSAEGPEIQIAAATLSDNSLRQTVHTHRTSVHQATKLVAALSRVAGVTAGLAESNGSSPSGLWLTSPAGRLQKTGISSGTLRWVIKYGLPLPLPNYSVRLKTVVTLTGVDAVVTGGDLSCAEMMRDLWTAITSSDENVPTLPWAAPRSVPTQTRECHLCRVAGNTVWSQTTARKTRFRFSSFRFCVFLKTRKIWKSPQFRISF